MEILRADFPDDQSAGRIENRVTGDGVRLPGAKGDRTPREAELERQPVRGLSVRFEQHAESSRRTPAEENQDRALAARGGFCGDATERFENFELTIDFRLTPVANSGILYRVLEREGDAIWYNAPEFQALDDSAYVADLGVDDMYKHHTGDNYDLHPSATEAANPVGEWNRARIIVDNGHVEHWLNGQQTVAYEIESPEWERLVEESKFVEYPEYGRTVSGHIGLQNYGYLVEYRNIKIRRLPRVLFNGRNLDGWKIHGTERWYVEDGELICESGPDAEYGYLATKAVYGDFDLTVDFKQEADGNSGVFFRSSLDGTVITGWQAEVAPPGNDTGGIYESYGRGWLIKPDPAKDSALVMGEWNTMRVRAVGGRVTTWLNGVEMIDFEDDVIGEATGAIALQIHSGGGIKVRWRNLALLPL